MKFFLLFIGSFLLACTDKVSILSDSKTKTSIFNLFFDPNAYNSYLLSNPNSVDFTKGVARLTPADQSDNATNNGFTQGTLSGVMWDSTNRVLRLNTKYNSAELDASWTPEYSNLIAYFKFNNTVTDSISGIAATPMATPTVSPPPPLFADYNFNTLISRLGTQAINFSGVPLEFTNNSLSFSSFTISVWTYPTYDPSTICTLRDGDCFFLSIGSSETPNKCIHLGYYSNNTKSGFRFSFYGDDLDINHPIASFKIDYKSWHHYVGTYNSINNQRKVYRDGVLIGSNVSSGFSGNTNKLKFSSLCSLNSQAATSYYFGGLDDVAIWKKELSPDQIKIIYDRQKAIYSGQFTSRIIDALSTQSWTSFFTTTTLPFYKELPDKNTNEKYSKMSSRLAEGLMGIWHLDESPTTTTVDSSGNGNTGTVVIPSPTPTISPIIPVLGSPGLFGNSGYFDGSNAIKINNSPILNPAGTNLTLSAWIKPATIVVPTPSNGYAVNIIAEKWNQYSFSIYNTGLYLGFYGNYYLNQSTGGLIGYYGGVLPGQWQHVAVSCTSNGLSFYINGELVGYNPVPFAIPTPNPNPSPLYIGNNGPGDRGFVGQIDELAIWSRALGAHEIEELYRRGANRVKYQIRSCSQSDCSDQTTTGGWLGPDGTSLTYFSELYNTTNNILAGTVLASYPIMNLPNFSSIPKQNNRYFQYRAILESDDQNQCSEYDDRAPCSPELISAGVGPDHYDTTVQTVTSGVGGAIPYSQLNQNSFIETLSANGCSSGVRYALSPDGQTFYYWNGFMWDTSIDYNTANDQNTLNQQISSFTSSVGQGALQIKMFLKSSGTSPCEVQSLQLSVVQ